MAKYYRQQPLIKPDHAKIRRMLFICIGGMDKDDIFTGPVLTAKESLYLAEWVAPDGKKRWAVWSTDKSDVSEIEIVGKASFTDYLGTKLKKLSAINDKVVFIVDADEVRIKQ